MTEYQLFNWPDRQVGIHYQCVIETDANHHQNVQMYESNEKDLGTSLFGSIVRSRCSQCTGKYLPGICDKICRECAPVYRR